jgi:cyclophilin family peptidyl-prolyl cis-trans isomerase/HEAT repeat protein
MRLRHGIAGAAAAVIGVTAVGAGQQRTLAAQLSARQAMFAAEDRRVESDAELSPLYRGLESRDLATVVAAIRGLGRMERPALAARLVPRLSDPDARIRFEAAHALGQLAQGIDSAVAARGASLAPIATALLDQVDRERDPFVQGALARSLGRLPYRAADLAERARRAVLRVVASPDPETSLEAARGLEALLRLGRAMLAPDPKTASALRTLAASQGGDPVTAAATRRIAWAALARGPDSPAGVLLDLGLRDPDAQVRRLAVLALAGADSLEERRGFLTRALRDPSPMVRLEALRGWGRHLQRDDCGPLLAALGDRSDHVSLAAIDLLGDGCPEGRDPVPMLWAFVDSLAGTQKGFLTGLAAWHRGAHALVALARLAPERVRGVLSRAAADYTPQVRMYTARAAAILGNASVLLSLADDTDPNVREAAVAGLVQVRGHAADPIFRAQLRQADYQLVITAANALGGSTDRGPAVAALVNALARITAERRETSRDARLAILERLAELGDSLQAGRLEPYLADFDPVVAERAARLSTQWTGTPRIASPQPLPVEVPSLEDVARYRGARLRVTMSPTAGGGEFEIELDPDLAPATVARIVKLARAAYYDELTFHRVVPNFVIQGGSPAANEYAGDGPFMRDEIGPLAHERGTLGISTRGRDTGDAQIFVNLVDNPRLDFNYTVWGRVVEGMDVVDAILEGDAISRVELLRTRH